MVTRFSPTRRLIPQAETIAAQLSRMILRAQDLHRSGLKYGDDDPSVVGNKRALKLTQPIDYMIMGDAIEMSVLAQAKIEAWITHCKAGEGDSQIHVLEIAVELLRDAKSDFEVATYADWVGPIDGLLDNLVELAHALARRLNANTERQRASGE